MENETLEQQTNGPYNDFEKFDNILSQNETMESNTDDRIRNSVDNAVIAVESRMHDAISTALNDEFNARVEMAVRSIKGSTGTRPNSIVQIPDRKDFTGNTEILRSDRLQVG